ncbi:MAG: dienelactone hydrolase family protein [Chloroflexi bacterium]|nr:dienelactone hydrolase family protein [Chloroflexota bacterium]
MVSFESDGTAISGYLARPRGDGSFPGLVVIHENRGLTPHIKDVAMRFANQGYVTLAVDFLSRVGGTDQFTTTEAAVAAIGSLSSDGVMKDAEAGVKYLQGLPYVRQDRIGVIGYCWGGGNSLLFATRNRDIRAAVVYYGPNPANIDDVANISARVLGVYGAEDTRITVNVPKLEEAMRELGKSFEYKVYQGAAHAFFNDTGARYHAESAADAWVVTLAFLDKNLRQEAS